MLQFCERLFTATWEMCLLSHIGIASCGRYMRCTAVVTSTRSAPNKLWMYLRYENISVRTNRRNDIDWCALLTCSCDFGIHRSLLLAEIVRQRRNGLFAATWHFSHPTSLLSTRCAVSDVTFFGFLPGPSWRRPQTINWPREILTEASFCRLQTTIDTERSTCSTPGVQRWRWYVPRSSDCWPVQNPVIYTAVDWKCRKSRWHEKPG